MVINANIIERAYIFMPEMLKEITVEVDKNSTFHEGMILLHRINRGGGQFITERFELGFEQIDLKSHPELRKIWINRTN